MNLATILDGHDDGRPALVSRGRTTTYGELRDQVARVRGGLADLGLVDGDRIALLCTNTRAFVVVELAALGLGLVVVPLNPTSPAAEVRTELGAAGARAVVADGRGRSALAGIGRDALPDLEHRIAADAPANGDGAGDAFTATLADLLAAEPRPVVDVEPDHLAALMFTSGTAGAPRAAMLTHGNLRSNLDSSLATTDRLRAEDVVYGVLPLFHIFGLNVALHATLARGACIVLVQRFDPATLIDSVRDRKVTVIPGVPQLWAALARFEPVDADALSTVRLALSGAAKLPDEVADRFEQRFGIRIREGYGLTETSATVTTSVGVKPKLGSIGVAMSGVEVRLVDGDGADVLRGDPGEIWVRGPNVFTGYWNDPEATARALTPDGWLRTGDVAVVDDDGFVFIVDRLKDLIIVSGFNVYPTEVEGVITMLPDVVESAVVGVPHPNTGEAVKAYIVATSGSDLDEEQVIEHCENHLARYKCPSKVLFVDELPRNVAGKLLRRALR